MKQGVDKILEYVLAFLLAVMVVNVLWQVVSRYLLGSPSTFTGELARFLLMWMALLGAAYVSGKRQHLAFELLKKYLKPSQNKYLGLFIHLLITLFACFVMVIGGFRLVYITLELGQTSASLQLPLGYVYLSIPLSGLLIMFYSIWNMCAVWQENVNP